MTENVSLFIMSLSYTHHQSSSDIRDSKTIFDLHATYLALLNAFGCLSSATLFKNRPGQIARPETL